MKQKGTPKLIICILIFVACSNREDIYFTGTITYHYTYESATMNTDSLERERPVKAIFGFDTLNYISRFFGKDTINYFYSGNRNKALEQINSNGNFTCANYGLATDSVLSVKQYAAAGTVLGQKCDILEMQKANSRVIYYVSRERKTAPATYKKHRSYNMDVYGEKTGGGLILKLEHRFKNFTMKGLAVEIAEKERSFRAFDIADSVFDKHCKN